MSNDNPSRGRRITAGVFPGWHGAIAGQKGSKLRAFGNEAVGGAVGGLPGQVLARTGLAHGNTKMAIGGLATQIAGGYAGAQHGVTRNARRGYYKPETTAKADTLRAIHAANVEEIEKSANSFASRAGRTAGRVLTHDKTGDALEIGAGLATAGALVNARRRIKRLEQPSVAKADAQGRRRFGRNMTLGVTGGAAVGGVVGHRIGTAARHVKKAAYSEWGTAPRRVQPRRPDGKYASHANDVVHVTVSTKAPKTSALQRYGKQKGSPWGSSARKGVRL